MAGLVKIVIKIVVGDGVTISVNAFLQLYNVFHSRLFVCPEQNVQLSDYSTWKTVYAFEFMPPNTNWKFKRRLIKK